MVLFDTLGLPFVSISLLACLVTCDLWLGKLLVLLMLWLLAA